VGGRIGWQAIARDLGVRSAADLPALAVCVTILAAVAIANLVALYPGVRAARMKVAETLQGEAPATN
jgi:ABC-type lipoprotein release transport system permease subunit